VKRELPAASRLPLFALAALVAAAVVALLFVLDPARHQAHRPRPAPSGPPGVVYGSPSPVSPPVPRPAPGAVAVGRRFLRLYAQLQTRALDAHAARRLRALASLALARTLLAQPPQPAGGGHAPATLTPVRVEPLSSSAVLLHAAIRQGHALLRLRCLVQLDRGHWTTTALNAAI
jgi:hypothetical protein